MFRQFKGIYVSTFSWCNAEFWRADLKLFLFFTCHFVGLKINSNS